MARRALAGKSKRAMQPATLPPPSSPRWRPFAGPPSRRRNSLQCTRTRGMLGAAIATVDGRLGPCCNATSPPSMTHQDVAPEPAPLRPYSTSRSLSPPPENPTPVDSASATAAALDDVDALAPCMLKVSAPRYSPRELAAPSPRPRAHGRPTNDSRGSQTATRGDPVAASQGHRRRAYVGPA